MRTDKKFTLNMSCRLILSLAIASTLTELADGAACAHDGPGQGIEGAEQVSPPVAAAVLKRHLQTLSRQGRLLSLDYDHGVYRVEILTPQGLQLRYRIEPVSAKLVRELTRREPARPPAGLLPLERLLQRVFAGESIQLLEAELEQDHDSPPVYELKWLQGGRLYQAHFDARTGKRLEAD